MILVLREKWKEEKLIYLFCPTTDLFEADVKAV